MADRIPSEEILSKRLNDLERQVKELQQTAMVLPFVNARMSSVMPGNFYGYMDDRVIVRRPDGTHFELRSATSPHIPVLAADPAAGSPVSVWVLATNGHLRIRTGGNILDFTPSSGAGAVTARAEIPNSTVQLPALGAIPTTRQTTYNAIWSGVYDGNNTRREVEHLYFGQNPNDSFGQQKSLIGFDWPNMASDLDDATILDVELFLAVMNFEYNSGTVRIGLHNNTSRPESYSNIYKTFTNALSFNKIEAGWRQITPELITGIISGKCKGVLIDQLTAAPEFYGYAAGATESLLPKVRVTYVK